MTRLKKGIDLIDLDGKSLTKDKVEATENKAVLSNGNPHTVVDAIAKVITHSTIESYPETMFCLRVELEEFKSKSGLYIPVVTKVSGDRTGKDGASRKLYRYFITGIGSMVSKCMDNADIAIGDELFIHAYEDLEVMRTPFIVDFEEFYDSGSMDASSYYTFHYTEIKGWKVQPILRAALAKIKKAK